MVLITHAIRSNLAARTSKFPDRMSGQGLRSHHQVGSIGGGNTDFDPELVALVCLTFGIALDLWCVHAVKLVLVVTLLIQQALGQCLCWK